MKKTFLLGALGYPMLELMYRGRTHYSMALAGGAAALLADRVRRLPANLLSKGLLCGVGITGVEYLCGCVWNRDFSVWDYRRMPLNWQGQICLPYSLIWCGLSAGLMKTLDRLEK